MANNPETITHIKVGNEIHPIDALFVNHQPAENIGELVTSISDESTDKQYPSAKCVYDLIGDIESRLSEI